MGIVWLRLPPTPSSIGSFTNAIFFGTAFLSFVAVAQVPAFIKDHATLIKERANGLYRLTAFMLANFLIGLPYLFLLALLFSSIVYFLKSFRLGASAFLTWMMWFFLDLLARDSLAVLMSSIFPNFIISPALVAFANELWMSVGGFLASAKILNPFWKYCFHYIDYVSPRPSLNHPTSPPTENYESTLTCVAYHSKVTACWSTDSATETTTVALVVSVCTRLLCSRIV